MQCGKASTFVRKYHWFHDNHTNSLLAIQTHAINMGHACNVLFYASTTPSTLIRGWSLWSRGNRHEQAKYKALFMVHVWHLIYHNIMSCTNLCHCIVWTGIEFHSAGKTVQYRSGSRRKIKTMVLNTPLPIGGAFWYISSNDRWCAILEGNPDITINSSRASDEYRH